MRSCPRRALPLSSMLAALALACACGGSESGGGTTPTPDTGNNSNIAADTAVEADSTPGEDTASDTATDDTTADLPEEMDTSDVAEDTSELDTTLAADVEHDSSEPDIAVDVAPDIEDEPDLPPDYDCTTFAVVEETFYALPQRFVQIDATGGSGLYRWAFTENVSGGDLDELNGRYLSGRLDFGESAIDRVEVHDQGCDLRIAVDVQVVKSAQIRPNFPEIGTGQQLCFEIEGGSGPHWAEDSPFVWQLIQQGSGIQSRVRADGCYTAGDQAGIDVLTVLDTRTEQLIQTAVTVVEGTTSLETSVPMLMLPANDAFTVRVSGGSGVYYANVEGVGATGLSVAPDIARPETDFVIRAGETPGNDRILFQDAFLPEVQHTLSVTGMKRIEHLPNPEHAPSNDNDIQWVGDINNDGYDDAMIGIRTAGINGTNSGAAYLYLGGQMQDGGGLGLGAEPAQLMTGPARNTYLGRSIASGDFNSDGCRDVAIGVWGESGGGSQTGEVQIWTGCNTEGDAWDGLTSWAGRLDDNLRNLPEGPPPLKLWRKVPGLNTSDRFGWATVAGDFNGDGEDDLAISAQRAEAPEQRNPDDNIPWRDLGRVYVFLNNGPEQGNEEWGVPIQPDIYIDGLHIGEEGELSGLARMYFGDRLASGDVNGDGCSELLVGSALSEGNHGFASLYMSKPDPEMPERCILSNTPHLALYPNAETRGRRTSLTGWQVKLADVSGDCVADILLTQPYAPIPGGSGGASGIMVAYFGRTEGWAPEGVDGPVRLYIDADVPEGSGSHVVDGRPDWIFRGGANDQFGLGMDIGDENGDGKLDIAVGSIGKEESGTQANLGAVYIFHGEAQRSCPLGCTTDNACRANEFCDRDVGVCMAVDGCENDGDCMGREYCDPNARRCVGIFECASDGDCEEGSWCRSPGTCEVDITCASDEDCIAGDVCNLEQTVCREPPKGLFAEPRLVTSDPTRRNDLMGRVVGFVGDADGDGDHEWATWTDRGSSGEAGDLTNHESRLSWHPGNAPDYSFTAMLRLDRPMPPYDDQFGLRVRNVGDLNADGFADYAVSAPAWDSLNTWNDSLLYSVRLGAVFIYFGGRDGLRNQPDRIIAYHPHHTDSDRFGQGLSAAGDVNNDGTADLVITALDEEAYGLCQQCRTTPNSAPGSTGVAYVYFGSSEMGGRYEGDSASVPLISAPDMVLCGPQVGSIRMSREVAGDFDFDGDDNDDFMFSNWNNSSQRGRVWAVPSAAGLAVDDGVVCVDESYELGQGDNNGDYLGYGIDAEDLDGDGCDDLIAGAYNADPPGNNNAGLLRVWFGHGPNCAHAQRIHVDLHGERAGDNIGRRVRAVGDVNGDRVGDLIVTSTGYGSANLWSVIIYSGATIRDALTGGFNDGDSITLNTSFRLAELLSPSQEISTGFGQGIDALGDINGDGLMDFIVGAYLSNYGGVINGGAAFVYFGSDTFEALEDADIVIVGETTLPDGWFGSEVSGGKLNTRNRESPVMLVVGAPFSEWPGAENGELGAFYMGILDL